LGVLQPKYGHWTRRRIAVVDHAVDRLRIRKERRHGIDPTLRFGECDEVLPVLALVGRIEVEALVARSSFA
jgi:hypothetical protein